MEWTAPSGKRFIWPCAKCDDTLMNGDEVDVDCGGSCNPCTVPPEPEPEPAWDPSMDDDDGQVDEDEDMPQGNGTAFFTQVAYSSKTNAVPPPGYSDGNGAGNPFYPWTAYSIAYNASHWRDWYPYHTGYG